MDIGAQTGAVILEIAADLAKLGLAACILGTVVMGIMIAFNVGNKGVQQHVRGWIWNTFWGVLLSGSATGIITKIQGAVKVS